MDYTCNLLSDLEFPCNTEDWWWCFPLLQKELVCLEPGHWRADEGVGCTLWQNHCFGATDHWKLELCKYWVLHWQLL